MHFSRDGQSLVACDEGGTIVIWDVRTQRKQRTLARRWKILPVPTTSRPAAAAFAPRKDTLAAGSCGEVAIWDVETLRKQATVWSKVRPQEYLFGVAFIVWAALGGLAGRRQAIEPKQEAASGPLPATAPEMAPQDVYDATVVDESIDLATHAEPGPQTHAPIAKPPTALRACWVMMIVGGVLAIMFSMALIFDVGSCCIFLPTVYYGVVTGTIAIVHGIRRSRSGLAPVSVMQMCNIINCDFFNLMLGLITNMLLREENVREFLDTKA